MDAVDRFLETIAFNADEITRVFEAARAWPAGEAARRAAFQPGRRRARRALRRTFGRSSRTLGRRRRRGLGAPKYGRSAAAGRLYTLRETQAPPIDLMRKHGVAMAVATDCNPGTSPMTSILLALNMAATLFRLTVEECLIGVTRNAARALGLDGELGSLEAGKLADFAIWDIERPAELVYRLGFNPLHRRVWRGR